jgi:UDP-perosamine 4-acetyltransferase
MAVDPTSLKAKLAVSYGEEHFVTVIAPDAFVARSAQVGAGCVVQSDVRLMPKVRLGRFVKVNIGAAVHHDCTVGNFCTLAPGSRLLGNVTLEDQVYIGAGAVVLNRLRIGKGATIGAGAVVTKDVAAGVTVIGVPARLLRKG